MSSRGGHKQRRTSEAQDVGAARQVGAKPESPLAVTLLKKWSMGDLSATALQELALAASQSGCTAPDVQLLAQLGTAGLHPANVQRDLVARFCKNLEAPEPWLVRTKAMAKNETGEKVEVDCHLPVFLPHLWVAALEQENLLDVLGLEKKSLFWKEQPKDNPRLSEHYFDRFDLEKDGPLPFTLHGDAAPHSEVDSLLVISMRSICTTLPVAVSQLLLCTIPKYCVTQQMMTDVWDALCWSLQALALGKHPEASPGKCTLPPSMKARIGKPLQAAVIYAITGDLEYFYTEFGWPRPNVAFPCPFCRCQQCLGCLNSGAAFAALMV
jgi:hypothetical protein